MIQAIMQTHNNSKVVALILKKSINNTKISFKKLLKNTQKLKLLQEKTSNKD
jgi:hypothetical protein